MEKRELEKRSLILLFWYKPKQILICTCVKQTQRSVTKATLKTTNL